MKNEDLITHENEELDLTTQSYEAKKRIDGVSILPIRRFKDDGGSFLELARLDASNGIKISSNYVPIQNDTKNVFELRQINHSYMQPGIVKAWHIHLNQDDLWFVPPHDRLLVGLYDLRKNSSTTNTEMRFILGDGEGQILLIPRGVAHGCSNPYDREMQLIYFVNQEFDQNTPDEHRLPYDSLVGKEFWKIQKG